MWATTNLPCRLWPHARATGNQGPFTVSARYSRPRKNIHYDYDAEEEEDEQEQEQEQEQESWKSQEIGDSDDASSSVEEREKISGSVVLLALEKARAEKTSNKAKKKKKIKKAVEDKRLTQGDSSKDYSAVKPLCIKSDWKDRLDQLETQLHHLLQKP